MAMEFVKSCGNVFADLELPDAEELSLKSQLVMNIDALMKKHGLTQKDVANRCGTDQPTVSKVLRGQLDLVGVERLLKWLALLNQDVAIVIRDDFAGNGKSGSIRVSGC